MLKGTAFISEQKAQILDAAIDKAERYLAALKDIKNGISEPVSCHKYQIPVSSLRNFMFKKFNRNKTNKVATDIYVKWQEKLFMDVANCNINEVPDTAIESMNYAVDNALKDKERDIILRRYAEAQTLEEIAQNYNVTRESIRQLETKALRKLQKKKGYK